MNGTLYDFHAAPLEALLGGPRLRRELLSLAQGKTLEVGAGTGFNFRYYPEGLEVIAIEPDAGMRKKARGRARWYANITVESADAESLPFADGTFDTVVVTLALCSVDDPEAALREVHRVLKPGGRVLLMEHVRKEAPVAGRVLDLLTPLWRRMSDGCHLNREPSRWIARSEFSVERYDRLWSGYGGRWVLKKKS